MGASAFGRCLLAGCWLACSSSTPPAETPRSSAETPPPATPAPASAAAPSGTPAPAPSASASVWKVAEVPGEPAGPELPRACQGAALDLDALLESKECDTSDDEGPSPDEASFEAAIEPANPTLRPKESVELTLRITNKTPDSLVLDLHVTERCLPFGTTVYDSKGKVADSEGGCGMLELCGQRTVRVRLDRGGSMTKKMPFTAEVSRESDDCEALPSRPMKRGTYKLVAELPFVDPNAKPHSGLVYRKTSTTLVVR